MGAGLFKTEQTFVANLDVNSSPVGADIYINNNLVGRTPAKGLPLMVKYDEYNYGLKVQQVIKEQYILRVSKRGYKDEVMTIPVKNTGDCVALGRCEPAGLTQTAFNFNLVPEEPANVTQENPSSSQNALPPKGTIAELKLGNIIYSGDKNQRAVMFENSWYREGDTIQVFDPNLMVKSITYRIEEISSNSVKLVNVNSKEGSIILGIKTGQ
jgi:hypothetical protein